MINAHILTYVADMEEYLGVIKKEVLVISNFSQKLESYRFAKKLGFPDTDDQLKIALDQTGIIIIIIISSTNNSNHYSNTKASRSSLVD